MEKIVGIETGHGIIQGRNGIYLDSLKHQSEDELTLKGQFDTENGFINYDITFFGILYLSQIELDFDQRDFLESFGSIENSLLIKKFQLLDHSAKLNAKHQHYYFRTYDSVFEIVASNYQLNI